MGKGLEQVSGYNLAKRVERPGDFDTAENKAAYITCEERIGFYSTIITPDDFAFNREVLKTVSDENALFLNVIGPAESLFVDKVVELLNDTSNDVSSVPEAVELVFNTLKNDSQKAVCVVMKAVEKGDFTTIDYSGVRNKR